MKQSPLFVSKEGASLKRWFKEKWTDEKGKSLLALKYRNLKE